MLKPLSRRLLSYYSIACYFLNLERKQSVRRAALRDLPPGDHSGDVGSYPENLKNAAVVVVLVVGRGTLATAAEKESNVGPRPLQPSRCRTSKEEGGGGGGRGVRWGRGSAKESHGRLLMTVQKKAAVHQWGGKELT